MIKRSSQSSRCSERGTAEESAYYQQKLKDALRAGVEALKDPEIAERVEAYFRNNPTYICDAIHVAAVATLLQREKAATNKQSVL